MRRQSSQRGDGWVSAGDLAKLGFCEIKLVLDKTRGERVNPDQEVARSTGTAEHLRLHRNATQHHNQGLTREGRGRRGPCFVATLVYGADDPRTNELRRFRDEVLRTRHHGRRLVSLYYRLAPAVCRVTARHPKALFLIRQCLDVTRWCLNAWFFRHTRKETQHGD